MSELCVSLVGCGAVALAHVPTVEGCARTRLGPLVDRDLGRARALAARHGVEALDDHRALAGRTDAAIVALPHHLHAPVAVDLLERGVHVLVEKPMALAPEECDRMLAAARASGAVLAVGMVSRFFANGPLVRALLASGLLGKVHSFEVREGFVYDWPVASDFMFRREAGGGVLADTGSHVLDQLGWWLGPLEPLACADDARGGVEADCALRLRTAAGAEGTVELSRTRALGNRWRIVGERGTLETARRFDAPLALALEGAPARLAGVLEGARGAREAPLDCFARQLDDFAGAVLDRRAPLVDGAQGRRVVDVLARARALRTELVHPWSAV